MKKPNLREVTRMVRETHEAWSHPDAGPERALLSFVPSDEKWEILPPHDPALDERGAVVSEHNEIIGSGKLDAVAVARRLIAGLP